MISLSEIRTVVRANTPYKTGFLFDNGIRFSEDSTKFSITYDGNVVPYMGYTEGKWVHKRWKGAVNPNEGWIKNNTVNDLNLMINTATSSEKSAIKKKYERKNSVREQLISQGNLQSLKGNVNR